MGEGVREGEVVSSVGQRDLRRSSAMVSSTLANVLRSGSSREQENPARPKKQFHQIGESEMCLPGTNDTQSGVPRTRSRMRRPVHHAWTLVARQSADGSALSLRRKLCVV